MDCVYRCEGKHSISIPSPPHVLCSNQSKVLFADLPGGAVVKNLPADSGDTGSSPGPGRSHMQRSNQAREPQLLSLHAITTEAHASRARALQQRVAPAHCS